MAELSNNPFIDHTASALSRFPNINTSSPTAPSAPQYSTPWPQQQQQQVSPGYIGAASPTGYNQQQQYFQQQQWPQQQPQQPQQQQQYQSQMQAPYPSTNFQSPGTFGSQQQFVGQVSPLATGYPQSQLQSQYADYPTQQVATYGYQQQQQPQQTGYGGGGYHRTLQQQPQLQQHQLQHQHQHQQQQLLSQFDPYVNLGQLSSPGSGSAPGSATASTITNGTLGSPPPGTQHPRMFIQTHKVELEAWDPPTWKQVQNVFEALKSAWETRKRAAEIQVRALGGTVGAPPSSTAPNTGFFGAGPAAGYGPYATYGVGGYQQQTPQAQEIDRLNSLIKEANDNVDTVAAAALQMSEVFAGYRHSGDIASKRRVRESCNAALSGLPEYPPPTL